MFSLWVEEAVADGLAAAAVLAVTCTQRTFT
jgi:hypothetical protein